MQQPSAHDSGDDPAEAHRPDLWLARHGETEWSAAGKHTSRTDLPLTERGRDAARRLGERLAGEEFAVVLTSPMQRARDTCSLAGFGDRAVVTDDLVEWDYGEYEGVTTDEIRNDRPGWTVFADGCPGGEQAADVARRVDRVIAQVLKSDGPTIAFAHGHVLRVLAARWCGLAPEVGANLVLGTATLSVLGWERETPAIQTWNA